MFAYHIALVFICATAFGRFIGILVLKFRQARYADHAVEVPRTWRDVCTAPEPYLLGAVVLWLLLGHGFPTEPSAIDLGCIALAFALAAAAVVLMLWSAWTFPSVSTGHYILPDQKIISTGPYALVRHPLYVAAFLVWFSLALAFTNLAVLLITLLYVLPSYLIYIRAEEEMLLRNLGGAYASYRTSVGMLFPRVRS